MVKYTTEETMYSKLLDISKKEGVPVKKILDLLYFLSKKSPIENNVLLRKVGVSKNALNIIKKNLNFLFKPTSKYTGLSDNLPNNIQQLFKNYKNEEHLWNFFKDSNFKKNTKILKKYKKQRPQPMRKYDQFTATIATTAKRASLMNFFCDIKEKRLLFLGDDDFTSLAAISFQQAENITVLDIDDRILHQLKSISSQSGFDINTIKYDARNPLPNSLLGKFDVVFIDPPYTPEAISLFISRAIDALDNKNKSARIYLCYGNSDKSNERFLPIYNALTKSGLMIRWIFDKFNRYNGAESIGSTSTLFICDVTPKSQAIIKGEYHEPIYTNN